MSGLDIFSYIQYTIFNMPVETKINLLNDCLVALENIQKVEPKLMKHLNNFMNVNSCVLDSESMKLLDFEFKTIKVNPNNLFVKAIQSGGVNNELVSVSNSPSNDENIETVSRPTTSIQNNAIIVNQPSLPVSELAQAIVAITSANIDETAKISILEKFLETTKINAEANKLNAEANKITAETQLTTAKIEQDSEALNRKVKIAGLTFSYAAPAAAVYFLNSTLNTVAVGTIKIAGSLVTTATTAAELTVLNAVPTVLNAGITAGKSMKEIIPTSLYSYLSTIVSTIKSTGITEYSTESYLGEKTAELTSVGVEVGTETIIIGCIIFYIALVLILSILSSIVFNIGNNRKFKAFIGFPGIGGISVGYGGKIRKTRKNKTKRRKHRKTYRKGV